ncbi:unannotated protein [freshwater metagenome]|uniref:Unannotated protein n=1 Tax=freshwater metagenome TaxID=449393 RepID=A0A6J6B2V4_9ZZZZ
MTEHCSNRAVGVTNFGSERNGRPVRKCSRGVTNERVVDVFLEFVVLLTNVETRGILCKHGTTENRCEVESFRLPMRDSSVHVENLAVTYSISKASEPQRRENLAHFFRDIFKKGFNKFGFTAETFS